MTRKERALRGRPVEFPIDDALPGLSTILDVDRVVEILNMGEYSCRLNLGRCKVTHIRYKPATNCLIAFSADADYQQPILFYAKCYLENDFYLALEKARQKEWVDILGVPAFVAIEEYFTIIYFFPNDCGLTGLPSVFDSRKLRRIIYEYDSTVSKKTTRLSYKRLGKTIARYKPERRAVIRVEAPITDLASGQEKDYSLYVRSYSDDQGQRIYDRMLRLHEFAEEAIDLIVARPLVYLADKQLLFVENLPGVPLLESFNESQTLSGCEASARALAALHRYPGEKETGREVNSLILDARSTANSLIAVAPDMKQEAETTLETLRSNSPEHDATVERFVHGDFYYGQILINNGQAALLDFDRSYRGDPLADVGNFCAHLKIANLQGRLSESKKAETIFLKAYADYSGNQLEKRRLDFWTAFGLFMLSVAPYRSLKSGWREFTLEVLRECQSNLP